MNRAIEELQALRASLIEEHQADLEAINRLIARISGDRTAGNVDAAPNPALDPIPTPRLPPIIRPVGWDQGTHQK